ncbi:radical SAM protein [Rhodospirillales bacterium]|nr:radical SAM protein [Rhodospirillales bacterium]
MKKFVCKHPWSHFEVNNPNGDVTMCCNNDTVLGNVNEATVEEVWNGEGFQSVRKQMRDEGALSMCPHTCPVLQGGKKYENLDWFTELTKNSDQRQNAELNEKEYTTGQTVLGSTPRWFRFTYSYACNLDCYHCYQREDAKMRVKLPDNFMKEVPKYVSKAQVIFPFGGEPFYFKPVVNFLEKHDAKLETRFYFITNATLLTDRIYDTLERLPIINMGASLDAATEKSFNELRVRGRNASWDTVLANLRRLQDLKERKKFSFTLSMTLNSVNCHEINSFVDLAISYDAEPLIMLVANPYQTADFQKTYLQFTDIQFEQMNAAINMALPKVKSRGFEDAEVYLKQLANVLDRHRETENKAAHFRAKKIARKAFHVLPEQLQMPIRRVVQKARTNRFEKYKTV